MTRRLLFVIPTLDRCGAEKQMVLLATGLPREEYDVHVRALTRGGPLETRLQEAGIPYEVIGKRGKLDPLAYHKLRRDMRELRPDLVQTWLFAANAYGRAAALSAGVPRIVAGERCVDPWKSWHQLAIDRWLARRTDRIVTNSSGVVDFYAARGLLRDKFRVIPNGVELPPPSRLSRDDFLAAFQLPEHARVIATVARLWPQKNVRDVIWAADQLRVFRDDVYLLVIGDGPLRSRLEKYARQIQVTDKVRFLGERDDVPSLLGHLEVVLLASAYEGLPNAVMEAMSAGRPVVATDIAGNRDLVVHGETGYLVPVGSVPDLAKFTNRLLDDPETARRYGEAGRRRVQSAFSVAAMIDGHRRLYDELWNQRGAV